MEMEMVEEANNEPPRLEEIVEEDEMKDRISELPDGLLVEILARLPSTKSVIRTGTLSKRWKYLWTSVPTFILDKINIGCPLSSSDFISLVDKTLTQFRHSKLRKFAVKAFCDVEFESQVSNWIRYAISLNVEELHLLLSGNPEIPLDESFFTNSCFTVLSLRGCIFEPTEAINWKSLESLSIYNADLDLGLVENILSGCPLLEILIIQDFDADWQLSITSKCIKKLMFSECCDGYREFESEINNWIRYFVSCNVEELNLRFDKEEDKADFMLNEEFFISSCLTDLKLSCCIFNPNWGIGWERLRSLYIDDAHLDEDVIKNILSESPLLETLVLKNCHGFRRLDISSKSVKKLVYDRHLDLDDESDDLEDAEDDVIDVSDGLADGIVEIYAPNILSLTIEGDLELLKLSFSNVASLVEATLCMKMIHDNATPVEVKMFRGFIQSLRHVKEFKINDYNIKDAGEQIIFEKDEPDRDSEFVMTMGSSASCNACRSYVGSISKEVQQLKDKFQQMEHEQAEREAEREQLKEKIEKMENEWAEQEAEWKARDAQREAKMKEMEDKLKGFEELLLSRFPRLPL